MFIGTKPNADETAARVHQLEAENARLRKLVADATQDRAALEQKLDASEKSLSRVRAAYVAALEQLQLAKRRLFVAKAERREAIPEQLELDGLFAQVQKLEAELAKAEQASSASSDDSSSTSKKKRNAKSAGAKSGGRRNLADSDLPLVRVEILDDTLEKTAERIGFEESWKLGYEQGGMRRIQVARAVYKVPGASVGTDAETTVDATCRYVTAKAPLELFRRSLLAPALIAHLLVAKYMLGVPFARQESLSALQGEGLDRGTMCRYAEDAGATLGAIVEASRRHAMETAFCLSTDATGVAIQPTPLADGKRQACQKGHFFVVLADQDYVFFEYQAKHTSKAVCEMFRGFSGYIQADANAVYDAMFRGKVAPTLWEEPVDPPPKEVGCWVHCRRNFWDAAVCKHAEGVMGLRAIDSLFAADRPLWDLPPSRRQQLRLERLTPLLDAFFAWVRDELKKDRPRGLVSKALGYALRQEAPLRRFLDDPRLKLDNNASERSIRPISIGRKNWLFFGSDDHAQAAANLFSLVATCKLHGIDPERYLAEVMRVMPYWTNERYLELSPRFWTETRARLDASELAQPIGHITVPPPAAQ